MFWRKLSTAVYVNQYCRCGRLCPIGSLLSHCSDTAFHHLTQNAAEKPYKPNQFPRRAVPKACSARSDMPTIPEQSLNETSGSCIKWVQVRKFSRCRLTKTFSKATPDLASGISKEASHCILHVDAIILQLIVSGLHGCAREAPRRNASTWRGFAIEATGISEPDSLKLISTSPVASR